MRQTFFKVCFEMAKEYQIASTSALSTVIFKDKASAPALQKFTSLFPGLGYAAGYKVCHSSEIPSSLHLQRLLTASPISPGPPKNLQIRRPTLRPRLPHLTPLLPLHLHLRPLHRKSHPQRHSRLPNRHRRNRPPPPRCPENQTPNQPRSLPRPRCRPHRPRRRNGSLPRRGLDRRPQRPRFLCPFRRERVRQREDFSASGL